MNFRYSIFWYFIQMQSEIFLYTCTCTCTVDSVRTAHRRIWKHSILHACSSWWSYSWSVSCSASESAHCPILDCPVRVCRHVAAEHPLRVRWNHTRRNQCCNPGWITLIRRTFILEAIIPALARSTYCSLENQRRFQTCRWSWQLASTVRSPRCKSDCRRSNWQQRP